MTQLPHDTKSSSSIAIRRRSNTPSWLWLALMGGSTAIHSVLVIAAVPLLGRLVKPPVAASSVPIELVELESVVPSQSLAQSNSTPSPPSAVEPVPAEALGLNPPTEQPASVQVPEPLPNTVSPSIAPTPETIPEPPPTPAPTAPAPPLQPAEPEFSTIPLDRPPPDVSETLPLPDNAVDPSTLARVGVDDARTPVRLTASLVAEPLPTEQPDGTLNPDNTLEQQAPPEGRVIRQDVATLGDAACLNAVTPAILPSLGTWVAVQVVTDVAGQIQQTVLQAPSQNPDYDALVQCLVQNWNFEQTEVQNGSVPEQALLVWVTVEPSDRSPQE